MSLTDGKSHFHVSVKGKYGGFGSRDEREAERQRRKDARAELKLRGYEDSKYFQYRNGDEAGKARQKERAEKYREEVEKATGVQMEVSEGFFLNLW
jgi:hypothetical protein